MLQLYTFYCYALNSAIISSAVSNLLFSPPVTLLFSDTLFSSLEDPLIFLFILSTFPHYFRIFSKLSIFLIIVLKFLFMNFLTFYIPSSFSTSRFFWWRTTFFSFFMCLVIIKWMLIIANYIAECLDSVTFP